MSRFLLIVVVFYMSASAQHYLGESYGGGRVFYVYDKGQHGLIAAPVESPGGSKWLISNTCWTRAVGNGIGAGLMNTAICVANQTPIGNNTFAAVECVRLAVTGSDGVTYSDWYLPSANELKLLYQNRSYIYPGLDGARNYWSSTESSDVNALGLSYSTGTIINFSKSLYCNVRAIRRF